MLYAKRLNVITPIKEFDYYYNHKLLTVTGALVSGRYFKGIVTPMVKAFAGASAPHRPQNPFKSSVINQT